MSASSSSIAAKLVESSKDDKAAVVRGTIELVDKPKKDEDPKMPTSIPEGLIEGSLVMEAVFRVKCPKLSNPDVMLILADERKMLVAVVAATRVPFTAEDVGKLIHTGKLRQDEQSEHVVATAVVSALGSVATKRKAPDEKKAPKKKKAKKKAPLTGADLRDKENEYNDKHEEVINLQRQLKELEEELGDLRKQLPVPESRVVGWFIVHSERHINGTLSLFYWDAKDKEAEWLETCLQVASGEQEDGWFHWNVLDAPDAKTDIVKHLTDKASAEQNKSDFIEGSGMPGDCHWYAAPIHFLSADQLKAMKPHAEKISKLVLCEVDHVEEFLALSVKGAN